MLGLNLRIISISLAWYNISCIGWRKIFFLLPTVIKQNCIDFKIYFELIFFSYFGKSSNISKFIFPLWADKWCYTINYFYKFISINLIDFFNFSKYLFSFSIFAIITVRLWNLRINYDNVFIWRNIIIKLLYIK